MPKSVQPPQKATPATQPTIQREEEKESSAKAQPNLAANQHITPAQVPYLQRAMGNRAVVKLLNNQRAGQIQRNFPHGASSTPMPQLEEEEPKIDAAGPQK